MAWLLQKSPIFLKGCHFLRAGLSPSNSFFNWVSMFLVLQGDVNNLVLHSFPFEISTKERCKVLNNLLKVLMNEKSQYKEIKDTDRRNEVKISVISDAIIIYLENPKDGYKTLCN